MEKIRTEAWEDCEVVQRAFWISLTTTAHWSSWCLTCCIANLHVHWFIVSVPYCLCNWVCMRERAESSNFTNSENSELSGVPCIKCLWILDDPCGKPPNITTMSDVGLYWTRLCSANWSQIFVANMLLDCAKGASEIVLHKKWQRRRSCQEASPHTLRCCTHRLTLRMPALLL